MENLGRTPPAVTTDEAVQSDDEEGARVTTASESIEATVDREVRCPVFHQDFSEPKPLGSYWALADRLREQGPLYFNSFAQGIGSSRATTL